MYFSISVVVAYFPSACLYPCLCPSKSSLCRLTRDVACTSSALILRRHWNTRAFPLNCQPEPKAYCGPSVTFPAPSPGYLCFSRPCAQHFPASPLCPLHPIHPPSHLDRAKSYTTLLLQSSAANPIQHSCSLLSATPPCPSSCLPLRLMSPAFPS